MKRKNKLFLWAVLLVAVVGLLQIPLNMEYFKIKQITVEHNVIVPTGTIMEKSQYTLKHNIFFFGKSRLKKTLLHIPQFADVKISRKFPDKINIDISEKKPWLNLLLADKNIIIDHEGTILNTSGTQTIDPSSIPLVRGLPSGILKQNHIEKNTLNMLTDVLSNLITLFRPEQLQLNLADPNNIEILADDILLIKIGEPANIQKKRAILKTFLAYIKNRWNQIEYIDIKAVKCPVIKFKNVHETLKPTDL